MVTCIVYHAHCIAIHEHHNVQKPNWGSESVSCLSMKKSKHTIVNFGGQMCLDTVDHFSRSSHVHRGTEPVMNYSHKQLLSDILIDCSKLDEQLVPTSTTNNIFSHLDNCLASNYFQDLPTPLCTIRKCQVNNLSISGKLDQRNKFTNYTL